MDFQIHALPPEPFAPLFAMSATALRERHARRVTVDEKPGYPCRVSLEDAEIGETVMLLHHEHQPAPSPFRASHAIYVRSGVVRARPSRNEVPASLASRLLSVRAFDEEHLMCDADVVEGENLGSCIRAMFDDGRVAYLHVHNAKPGCYAAKVTRVREAAVPRDRPRATTSG